MNILRGNFKILLWILVHFLKLLEGSGPNRPSSFEISLNNLLQISHRNTKHDLYTALVPTVVLSKHIKRDTLNNVEKLGNEVMLPVGQHPKLGVYQAAINKFVDLDVYYSKEIGKLASDQYLEKVTANSDLAENEEDADERSSKVNNNNLEKTPGFKSSEYDEKSIGTILDSFDTEKFNANEAKSLPVFLTEPESSFLVKNRPAILKCKAAHALQIYFKCSGSSQPPPSSYDKHVDPHTGVHLEELTATISRDLVDEYFGNGPFKCECLAWSSRGVVKSRAASINVAFIRKQFSTTPTSLRVELGSKAELHCEPPSGIPTPKINWYKNDAPLKLTGEESITVTIKGTLLFQQVTLQDMANYTCSAENIAGKRISDSAVLIVFVNGGWSSWGPWTDCKCSDNTSHGRKRQRNCNNPIPVNGGMTCTGPQTQKSQDCVLCPEDTQIVSSDGLDASLGRWLAWSEWSTCSSDCIQFRRRKCIPQTQDDAEIGNNDNSRLCSGKDFQTAECRGGDCHIGKNDFDWALYMGLVFIAAVCFTFGAILIFCAKRSLDQNSHYNIARTVLESEYIHNADKKSIGTHEETNNINYDYANLGQRCENDEQILNYAMSEHLYDVPNLSTNYTNPVDELSMEYLTDTADTSTCTSNSTYDITTKLPTLSISKKNLCKLSTARDVFHSSGGHLRLYNGEIMLYIPQLAIGKNQKRNVTLTVLSDDTAHISIPCAESLLVCSTIVHCSPSEQCFLKPVILKIPHCLTNSDLWNVSIYHSESQRDELNVSWRKISTVGQETINTPIFTHLDPAHAYLMTEQLGRYAIVAEPKSSVSSLEISVRMKLFAFSQVTPNSCILRIYVVRNFPNSKDICSRIESQLGGTFLGKSSAFEFYFDNSNLRIRVRQFHTNTFSWDVEVDSDMQEQIIPYNHIVRNNSILHCEFSVKRNEHFGTGNGFEVEFVQSCDNKDQEYLKFSLLSRGNTSPITAALERTATVSVDKQGSCINDIGNLENIQLPPLTKRKICAAMDPPRLDENDWRQLAKKFNTDHYIAYFATKASPTEQILNLLECRANNSSKIILELIAILRDMNRHDIVAIIEQTIEQQWI